MPVVRITDPAQTLERLFERLHFLERDLAAADGDGAKRYYRRRIAATRGAITRVTKMLT